MKFPFFNKTNNKTLSRKAIDIESMFSAAGDVFRSGMGYTALATEGFVKNPVVYRCVTRKAEAGSMVGFKLFRYKPDGTKEEVLKHPILDLLEKPNPLMSFPELVADMLTEKSIGGEAFLKLTEVGGKPQEIWPISPKDMTVEYQSTGDTFVYRVGTQAYQARGAENYKSQIMQWKYKNPLNALRGLSPMIAAGKSIESLNSAADWNKNLLNNAANPSGALIAEETLTEEQYLKLKAQINENYSGSKNAGRPLLLEGKMEWQEMSLSPKDMDFQNGKLADARNICTVYGVPSQLVGIVGESTYSNYQHALLAFWQDTMAPECLSLVMALNRWLMPWYKDDSLWLEVDYSNIDALEPRKAEKADRINKLSNVITINEARKELGYEDIEEGDDIYIDGGKVPLESLDESLMNGAQDELNAGIEEIRNQRAKPKPEESAS